MQKYFKSKFSVYYTVRANKQTNKQTNAVKLSLFSLSRRSMNHEPIHTHSDFSVTFSLSKNKEKVKLQKKFLSKFCLSWKGIASKASINKSSPKKTLTSKKPPHISLPSSSHSSSLSLLSVNHHDYVLHPLFLSLKPYKFIFFIYIYAMFTWCGEGNLQISLIIVWNKSLSDKVMNSLC